MDLYAHVGIGRPYRRSIGVQDSCRWFLCMNPLQSAMLSEAEFVEMDVTFENSKDYPYLLNITRFSYATMKCKKLHLASKSRCNEIVSYNYTGITVARVRMTSTSAQAYAVAISAVFDCCNDDNNTDVAKSLKAIIIDWSDAQIAGLKSVVGEQRSEELLRGCQVL